MSRKEAPHFAGVATRKSEDIGRKRPPRHCGSERLRPRINRLRCSKAWGDLGDLKRGLLDLWTEERNTLAKAVMQDIEAQRKQRRVAK